MPSSPDMLQNRFSSAAVIFSTRAMLDSSVMAACGSALPVSSAAFMTSKGSVDRIDST